MARGYEGAFAGRNAPYVRIPLMLLSWCVVDLCGDWARPLDLLVLLAFARRCFFNAARSRRRAARVPGPGRPAGPTLVAISPATRAGPLYLLRRSPGGARPRVSWSASVWRSTRSILNVIDVGYAGDRGRLDRRRGPVTRASRDEQRAGSTYWSLQYLAYVHLRAGVPMERDLGRPAAADGAAMTFDALTLLGLVLLLVRLRRGREARRRPRSAWAWAAYP